MSIDSENLKRFVDTGKCDQKLLFQTLNEIVLLVIIRFYSKYIDDSELFSIGISKATTLLMSKHVNSSKNIVSFVFSGVRNEIGNSLKKEKKYPSREISVYDADSTGTAGDNLCAMDSIERRVYEYESHFSELGIQTNLDFKGILDGREKEVKGYERFMLRAAFLWELSGEG